jgi:hypothetical protein
VLLLLMFPTYHVLRYNWLMNFILCNNNAGLDQTGSFTTATKCLKVRGGGNQGRLWRPQGGRGGGGGGGYPGGPGWGF